MGFFDNQDWVWGLGLMISGMFFLMIVLKIGPRRFRAEILRDAGGKLKIGRGFDFLVTILLPVQVIAMLAWWFYDSYKNNPEGWLNPFGKFTVGTVLFQWGIALGVFLLLNKTLTRLMKRGQNVD